MITTTEGTRLGEGWLHPANSVGLPGMAERVLAYKRQVASRYRGLRQDELDQLPPGALHVSPKIDGQLWFLTVAEGAPLLVAHNGRVLRGALPFLTEAAGTFAARAQAGTVIAGELFAVRKEGRPRVGDVGAALSGNADLARLGFHAFDVVSLGETAPPEAYADRLAELERLLEGGRRVQAIKTEVVAGAPAVSERYATWVESGKAEGLVARAADGRIYKIKPAFHVDCAVIGFTERTEEPGHVRSLLLTLLRPDGTHQPVGSCSNLLDDAHRRSLHDRLAPAVVASRFRKSSSSGALYKLVRPELIVEVVCTDVITEDSEGEPLRQWALTLDATDGWIPLAPVPGGSLLHPRLERVRDDKRLDTTDVRLAQLEERAPVEGLDLVAAAPRLSPARVLRREVFTKTTKGELAVRKLVVWATNKHEVDPDFPPYVVHFTDFSAGRKDPLQRTVRLAATEDDANSLADALLEENIKKGWERA